MILRNILSTAIKACAKSKKVKILNLWAHKKMVDKISSTKPNQFFSTKIFFIFILYVHF